MNPELVPRLAGGGRAENRQGIWRLEIPAGSQRTYRLAQVDDYASLPRRRFPHRPPLTLSLRARFSAASLPGTWGFGLWNDPFGLSLGFGGSAGRLPALPNAAWFFHASPPNHLAFRDGVPAQGFFAGVMRAPAIPALLFAPAAPCLPLLALRPFSRLVRRLAGGLVRQDGAPLQVEARRWHAYTLQWTAAGCRFLLDGQEVLTSPLAPRQPLALVIWIDNQFAAWQPDGRLRWGLLDAPAAWLEIADLSLEPCP
ncbi:MAG: hypothetical protein ABWK53_06215 [Anaerolineales bacterium]